MKLITSDAISDLCDYSFGDYACRRHNLEVGTMKEVNKNNHEFISMYHHFRDIGLNYMTLFIDNVRLYGRPVFPRIGSDKALFENAMKDNDLLKLCASLPDMKFIIFTGHEDLSIDEHIDGLIPKNVLMVFSINTAYVGEPKVTPLYYGLKRKMSKNDNTLSVFENKLKTPKAISEYKLLYINHSVVTNPQARQGINELFVDKRWATVEGGLRYDAYLEAIQQHLFVVCPVGNAIDCHRNYEVLYNRRIPIMLNNTYLKKLYEKLPVLWVDKWQDVTEQLLHNSYHLVSRIKYCDIERILDANSLFRDCIDYSIIFNKPVN